MTASKIQTEGQTAGESAVINGQRSGATPGPHTHVEADITDLGAYIEKLQDDADPTLGANLDVNDKVIFNGASGRVVITLDSADTFPDFRIRDELGVTVWGVDVDGHLVPTVWYADASASSRIDITKIRVGLGWDNVEDVLDAETKKTSATPLPSVVTFRRSVSGGSGAAGTGIRRTIQIENAAGTEDTDAAYLDCDWDDATNGAEDAALEWLLSVAGSMAKRLRLDEHGLQVSKSATFESQLNLGTKTAGFDIDWRSAQDQKVTINAAGPLTVTFNNDPTGPCFVRLEVVQGSTPGTLTFSDAGFGDAGAPTLGGTTADVNILGFYWNGSTWYGTSMGSTF